MLQNVLTLITRLIIVVVALGLAAGLFFIGIIALWYFILAATIVWVFRRIYQAWQIRATGGVEVIPPQTRPHQRQRPGRIIDHE